MERRVPRAQLEAVTSNSDGLRKRRSRSGRNGDPVACGRAASTSISHETEDVTVFLPRALLAQFSRACSRRRGRAAGPLLLVPRFEVGGDRGNRTFARRTLGLRTTKDQGRTQNEGQRTKARCSIEVKLL